MWSYGEFTGTKHKEWDINKIRETFGSETVATAGRMALN